MMLIAGITEIRGANNFTYIFDDKDCFSLTEYKVMRNMEDKGFVKCAKSIFNGKVKIVYFLDGHVTLDKLIKDFDIEQIVHVMTKVVDRINHLKKNGFLNCQNVDLNVDKICVDTSSMQVKMVYLPINSVNTENDNFDRKVREFFAELVTKSSRIESRIAESICAQILDEDFALEKLKEQIACLNSESDNRYANSNVMGNNKAIIEEKSESAIFRSTDRLHPCMFEIDKMEFTIGKKGSAVDGYIPFNSAISRVHCKIIKKESDYHILDLESINGTFINGMRLEPNKLYGLRDGDIIRLANSEFVINVR